MAPEVDEIIPISKGGSPLDWNNVQLVHRRCNQRKGNHVRVINRDMKIQTSREW